MRSPGPAGGGHSPPLPQPRAHPHLQSEFSEVLPTPSLGAPAGASRSPVEGAGQALGCVCAWMWVKGGTLWAAVWGGGGWEPTFSSHAAPANAGRPSEVDGLQVLLWLRQSRGPSQSCKAGEF